MFVAPATLEQESRTVPDVMKYELDGMVAVLTLNRPEKLNALSNELLDALMDTLDRIELDRAVRSVVITGAGRAFSAGADNFEIFRTSGRRRAQPQSARSPQSWRGRITPKITIAA